MECGRNCCICNRNRHFTAYCLWNNRTRERQFLLPDALWRNRFKRNDTSGNFWFLHTCAYGRLLACNQWNRHAYQQSWRVDENNTARNDWRSCRNCCVRPCIGMDFQALPRHDHFASHRIHCRKPSHNLAVENLRERGSSYGKRQHSA